MAILLLKSIANTNTSPFVTILFTTFTYSAMCIFWQSSVNKVNKMIVVEKMAKLHYGKTTQSYTAL